ncbi:uncharacterized protein LOC142005068 [Carettochelys insculpta]|uniref:uncharacterized protein LOC142005068 n=1 Tax=Carettochelys insculpta TaxID=44489 RepID=UPI003EBA315E
MGPRLLAALLALAPCALGQVQLAASGPALGKVSEPLTLTCAVSGVSIDEQYNYWHWVRQGPGGGPESMGWIYPYNGDTGYAPSFQGRVTISADTAQNQVSLQLRSLTAADTGTYYCARGTVTRRAAGPLQKGGGGVTRFPSPRDPPTPPLCAAPGRRRRKPLRGGAGQDWSPPSWAGGGVGDKAQGPGRGAGTRLRGSPPHLARRAVVSRGPQVPARSRPCSLGAAPELLLQPPGIHRPEPSAQGPSEAGRGLPGCSPGDTRALRISGPSALCLPEGTGARYRGWQPAAQTSPSSPELSAARWGSGGAGDVGALPRDAMGPPGAGPGPGPGPGCPGPGAAGGVRPGAGEGLGAPHPDLRRLRGLHHRSELRLALGAAGSWRRAGVHGVDLSKYRCYRLRPVLPGPGHHLGGHGPEPAKRREATFSPSVPFFTPYLEGVMSTGVIHGPARLCAPGSVGLSVLVQTALITTGDLPPFQLVEFGPAVVQPSETLRLNCAVYGYYITQGWSAWYWFKRSPRKGLEWIGLINYKGNTAYAPSFRSRIIIARDTSKNQFSFQLRSLTGADRATYHCARRLGTQWLGAKQELSKNMKDPPPRREGGCRVSGKGASRQRGKESAQETARRETENCNCIDRGGALTFDLHVRSK